MAKDPVCGMMVDEKTAKFKTVHMGKTYYFCSAGCKATFDKDPIKFMGGHMGHTGHSGHCGVVKIKTTGKTSISIGIFILVSF